MTIPSGTGAARMRLARGLRRATVVLCTSIPLCAVMVSAQIAVAAEAGVNASNPTVAQVADMNALGTHWVRMFVSWRALQPTRAGIDTTALSSYEQKLRSLPAGSRLIVDVVGSPQWETGSADEHAPPANPQDYARFIGTLAQRFAGHISAYEIWNEEDAPAWWTGAPDPAAYVQLLKAAYPAVKAADPRATVVLGGLTGNDYQFVEGVYAAGGKGFFDAVGVHTDTACNKLSPYEFLRGADNRLITDSFLAYREVHAVMLANGDDKPIWMTELSWRTTGATCAEGAWAGKTAAGVSEATQATYLRQAYHCLAQDPYVQVALWFPLQDEGPILSGLVRAGGSHKPSFAAMRDYVKNGDQLREPCGNFTGPKLTIASPTSHLRYQGPLPIHVWARSAAGVFRITLEVDGHLIRNYDGPSYPTTLSGVLQWQGAKHISYGRHVLTFLAYDKQRNISRVSIAVYHLRAKAGHRRRQHRRHR